jgi:multiple sugar transport system substrate-binding protein
MATKSLNRRQFLKLAAGVGGAAALAACVPPPPAPAPTAAPKEVAPTTKPAAEAITLTFGHHWEAAFQPREEEFQKKWLEKFPGVTIKNTYNTWAEHNRIVPTWAAAGQLPDIIYVHGRYAFPWNHEGLMKPLDEFIKADAAFDIQGVWPEALRLYSYKGKQYEIPYDHGPVIMGYNKDVFDQAGLKYPDETWTWDTFLDVAKKTTDPKKPQWGYGGYYGNVVSLGNEFGIALTGPFGGKIFNDDDTKLLLDSPESIAGLQFHADLITKHKVAPTQAESQAYPQGAHIAGVCAMFALASWGSPSMIQFANFKWDVAPWPKGPKGQKTGSFGSGFGITRDSKQPDIAWKYLREYLSKEGMEFMWGSSGRGSPARKAAYDSWLKSPGSAANAKYFMEALDKYAETGHPYQTLAGGQIMDIFDRNTTLVQTGEKTIQQAVADIIKEGQPVLDDAAKRLKG